MLHYTADIMQNLGVRALWDKGYAAVGDVRSCSFRALRPTTGTVSRDREPQRRKKEKKNVIALISSLIPANLIAEV